MHTPKQSILWRKVTKPSAKNVTSAEKLAETERIRLQAKQSKQAMLLESRRIALYGTPAEKARTQADLWETGSILQVQKRLERKEERKKDIRECREYQALNMLLDRQARDRDSHRKEMLREFQAENRRMIENRSAERVREKVREESRDRREMERHGRCHTPNVL